jgi:diguanylate cyclase (GGDEF)-like protein
VKSDPGVSIPPARRTALVLVPVRAGRDVVLRILRKERIHAHVARDAYEAVALFLREPSKLLIVSLEGLRRKDRSFLRELRRYSPDLRILLLVPDGRRADVPAYLEAGADALLMTPLHSTELHYLVRSLLRSAASDPLTSLPNRGAYDHALRREISRARREGQTLGLALVDLDRFKRINERYGLRGGDSVLVRVARRLRNAFRITDVVTRWGGEEFAILLTGLPKDLERARQMSCDAVERARTRVRGRKVRVTPGTGIRVTLSAGLALFPHEASHAEELFRRANRRLRLAKRRGRDRIEPCEDPKVVARPTPAAEEPPMSAGAAM